MIKQERVELHLHTTVSDDVSVINPKEAIETAVELGHKAVAITNLNSVQDFAELEECQRKYGNNIKVIYGAEVRYLKDNTTYGISLLAKNKDGLKGLYRILSSMRRQGVCKVVDWQVIEDNRENLLCGCACSSMTELMASVMFSKDTAEQQAKIAMLYDYIALVPYDYPEEKAVNQQLYTIGKANGIPVVAVGNCHYIRQEDRICKKILSNIYGKAEELRSTHFRTTEEMLEEFSYLGSEAAYEAVVTNTNLIADRIETIYPTMNRTYPPFALPNANEEVRRLCIEKLHALYGSQPPEKIVERLETELKMLERNHYASLYLLTGRIVQLLHEKGEVTVSRGPIGSSLVAYLLEISDINPVPPHYYCSACGYADFDVDAVSGYDLSSKRCPCCGEEMRGDGHNIPYETCMGLDGGDAPDMEINISEEAMSEAQRFLIELLGKERVAYAGTVGSIAYYQAEKYVKAYMEQTGEMFSDEQHAQILSKLTGVKRSEGRHPGGIVVLPEGMEFEDITPLRKPDDPLYGIDRVTHMNYYSIRSALPKINFLRHIDNKWLKALFQLTGVKPEEIDYNDPEMYKLLREGDLSPEYFHDILKQMLKSVQPENFSDMVRLFGVYYGVEVWHNNGEHLTREHPLRELIGDRDDIFLTLQKYGVDRETAYLAMCMARKGDFRHCPEEAQKLLQLGVPEWYIQSIQKIRYLLSKAHLAANVKRAVSLAWFQLYYPKEFQSVSQS